MNDEQNHNPVTQVLFRNAISSDASAIAQLHTLVWRETYQPIFGKEYPFPTTEIRERQWKQKFASKDANWFCIVAEFKQRLVGFAAGNNYSSSDLPDFDGELNKLYVLQEFKGLGIGKRLFTEACVQFLKCGISTMVVFAEPQNPTIQFFERMGGNKILDQNGLFHGAYGWFDLNSVLKV